MEEYKNPADNVNKGDDNLITTNPSLDPSASRADIERFLTEHGAGMAAAHVAAGYKNGKAGPDGPVTDRWGEAARQVLDGRVDTARLASEVYHNMTGHQLASLHEGTRGLLADAGVQLPPTLEQMPAPGAEAGVPVEPPVVPPPAFEQR